MRYFLANALYWMGHAVSLVMDYWPWETAHPYYLYNRLMVGSVRVQGDADGPWMRIN